MSPAAIARSSDMGSKSYSPPDDHSDDLFSPTMTNNGRRSTISGSNALESAGKISGKLTAPGVLKTTPSNSNIKRKSVKFGEDVDLVAQGPLSPNFYHQSSFSANSNDSSSNLLSNKKTGARQFSFNTKKT